MISGSSLRSAIAAWSLLAVMAGFVLYQSGVDAGYVPHLAGGGFTAACALVAPVLTLAYARETLRTGWGRSRFGWAYLAFLLLFAQRIGSANHVDPDLVASHWAYLFKLVVLFMLARLIDPRTQSFRQLLWAGLLVSCAAVLARVRNGDFLEVQWISSIEDFQLDYQGFGLAILTLSIFCAATVRGWMRLACYALGLAALFISGARSELTAFLLAIGVIQFCGARQRIQMVFTTAIVLMAAGVAASNIQLPDQRVFRLLHLSQDESAIERLGQIQDAIATIEAHPLTGSYGSYVNGYEAHNILSAWVDLGLAGFLLESCLVVLPALILLRHMRAHRRDPLFVLALCFFAVSALLLAFAKSFTYMTVPIALGLYCRWDSERRRAKADIAAPR